MSTHTHLERSSDETPQTLVCTKCGNKLTVHVAPSKTVNGWTEAWCFRTNLHDDAAKQRLRVVVR